jgi:tetratricopeptide (TPR) repeat protein
MLRSLITFRLLAVALIALAGLGCVSSTPADDARQRLRAQIRSRGLDPDVVVVPFELDAEMRTWVRESVQTGGDPDQRLEQLLRALLHRKGTVLTYQAGVTGTARDVWKTNRANCLAFTHIYVGLARELGLSVYYLRVSDLENFEKEGDLVIASEHVTAAHGPPTRRRVLDFLERPLPDYHSTELMSDLTAIALHYSNVGAERILDGHLEEAEALLRTSVRLEPELGDGWVNLGVALRRLGRVSEAETSFRRALEANPELLAAYTNLASLLERQGRVEESRRLLELTDRRRNRNPFTYLALGDLALSQGRLQDAERFFRRAQRLHPDRAAPHAALGQWAVAAGRCREAVRLLQKAEKMDPQEPRNGELARNLRDRDGRCFEPVRSGILSPATSSWR